MALRIGWTRRKENCTAMGNGTAKCKWHGQLEMARRNVNGAASMKWPLEGRFEAAQVYSGAYVIPAHRN